MVELKAIRGLCHQGIEQLSKVARFPIGAVSFVTDSIFCFLSYCSVSPHMAQNHI